MNPPTESRVVDFGIDTRQAPDGLHVRLSGRLDADAAPVLSAAFEEWSSNRVARVVLDLGDLDVISSAGVGSLIAGVGETRDEGGAVEIVTISAAVQHVLEMLDLVDFLSGPENEA